MTSKKLPDKAFTDYIDQNMEKQPSFDSDPTGYLQFLIHAHPPSLLLLERLAGSIATFQKDNTDANIASLYLQACAKHLIVQNVAATGKTTQNRTNNHNELLSDSMLNEIYTVRGDYMTNTNDDHHVWERSRQLFSNPIIYELYPCYIFFI